MMDLNDLSNEITAVIEQEGNILCCEVIGDVGMFVGEAEQFDDITMLAFKFKGEEGESLKPKAYVLDGSSTTPTRD